MNDDVTEPRCQSFAYNNGEVQCEREWGHSVCGPDPINWHRNGGFSWNTPTHSGPHPTSVPRVAESLDDLAVGQVVVGRARGHWYEPIEIMVMSAARVWFDSFQTAEDGLVVILADPPAPPAPEEGIKCPTCGVARGWNTDGHLTRGIWTLNCSQCGSFQVEIEDTSVPAPHAEAEAAAKAAFEQWRAEQRHPVLYYDSVTFIAGYLRGRGDRG